jgi:hypothetical protein
MRRRSIRHDVGEARHVDARRQHVVDEYFGHQRRQPIRRTGMRSGSELKAPAVRPKSIESAWIDIERRVAIRRSDRHYDHIARLDELSGDNRVFRDEANGRAGRRLEAGHLLNHRREREPPLP